MNSTKKIAIFLATYNGAKYLNEQIDSLISQKDVLIDIFVRDDHSNDDTNLILANYKLQLQNFIILQTLDEQLGPCRNFFSILKEVDLNKYDFISYCDQDDKWLVDKIKQAVDKIEFEGVNCYASDLTLWDGIKVTGKLHKSTQQTKYDFMFESASAGCTLVLDRNSALYLQSSILNCFEKLPFNSSHDWYTYAATRIGGFKWHIDNRSFILYRQHDSNQHGANIGVKGIKKLLNFFSSGWYRENILRISDLFYDDLNKPSFINELIRYDSLSVYSRIKLALKVVGYRRKAFHRASLFILIVLKIIK